MEPSKRCTVDALLSYNSAIETLKNETSVKKDFKSVIKKFVNDIIMLLGLSYHNVFRPTYIKLYPRNCDVSNAFTSQVFAAVRESNPNFGEKLTCVSCDLEAEDLGLSNSSRILLQNEVDVFFHSAASLKFNEKFRYVLVCFWLIHCLTL